MLLLLLSLAGYITFTRCFLSSRYYSTPLTVSAILILTLSAAAAADLLYFAASALLWGGVLALFCRLLLLIRHYQSFTPVELYELSLFSLIFTAFWFQYNDGRLAYHLWDEFSQWGVMFDEMWRHHRLLDATAPVSHHEYPPGLSIFQYFLARSTHYNEGIGYFANNLVIASGVIAMCRHSSGFAGPLSTLALVVSLLFGAAVLDLDPDSLYTDLALGVLFACTVVQRCGSTDRNDFLTAAIVMASLPLIKSMGLVFCFLSCAVSLAGISKLDLRALKSAFQLRAVKLLPTVRWVLLSLPAPLLVHWSWNKVRPEGTPSCFHKPDLMDVLRSFSPLRSARDSSITERFLSHIVSGRGFKTDFSNLTLIIRKAFTINLPIPPYWISPLGLVLFLVGFGCLVGLYKRRVTTGAPLFSIHVATFFGFLSYCVLLLFLYIHVMPRYDGYILASANRYLNTYLIGWMCIAAFTVYNLQTSAIAKCTGALALAVLSVSISGIEDLRLFMKGKEQLWRLPEIERANIIRRRLSANSSVYILDQHSSGELFWRTRYHLLPLRSNYWDSINNEHSWSLGAKYSETDEWTSDVSTSQFCENVREYDALYAIQMDSPFIARYSSCFASLRPGSGFYLVRPHQDSPLWLDEAVTSEIVKTHRSPE